MIGRAGELADLTAAMRGARDTSHGGVTFVVGESGVGKSRLVREVVDEARRERMPILAGRGTPVGGTVAFRPFSEALFSYFRGAAIPDGPELEPFRTALARLVPEWRRGASQGTDDSIVLLSEALLRLLRVVGGERGCLLILEDLHWADPETLAIVDYLAENLASEPVVCVCTVRSEESSSALDLVHGLEARRVGATIRLARLEPADTAAMARACLSAAELPQAVQGLVSANSDGLPFFVEELLAGAVSAGALVQDQAGWTVRGPLEPHVPRTFLDSVDRRLAAVGDASSVITAAAVLGRRFDWTLLVPVTGAPQEAVLNALRAGVDAQLLVADPTQSESFRFRHALTREAVVGRLLPIEWAAIARRAINAIQEAHPGLDDEWCDLSASLAERAGDRARAADLLLQSGKRSMARGALASAEDAFERAWELVVDAEPTAEVGEALCEVLALAGKLDRALEVARRVPDGLRSLGAPPQRIGRIHLGLAAAAVAAARRDVADRHLEQARRFAAEAGERSLIARVSLVEAEVAISGGDLDQAKNLAQAALADAEELGLHALACEASQVLGRCARASDTDLAERMFMQAVALAERHGLEVERMEALFELGTIDLMTDGPADRLQAARELATANGALATGAQIDMHLGAWHLDHFENDAAIAAARRSSEVARRVRMPEILALGLVIEATGHARLGRGHDTETLVSEALALAGDEPSVAGLMWGLCRAEPSLIGEDRKRALREFDAMMDSLRRLSTSPPIPQRGMWALMRVLENIDGDGACSEVRESGVTAKHLNLAFMFHADAVLHGRAGRRDEAEAAFAAGDEILARVGWYRHFARRLVAEAAIADGWGDPVGWLRVALPHFEKHGQERLVAACRSLLHKAGATVPRRDPDSRIPSALREFGVTEREVEVLTLLAEGLGNKEIATRLYLSPRTVERHIANLNDKMSLRTRSELIAFAARSTSRQS